MQQAPTSMACRERRVSEDHFPGSSYRDCQQHQTAWDLSWQQPYLQWTSRKDQKENLQETWPSQAFETISSILCKSNFLQCSCAACDGLRCLRMGWQFHCHSNTMLRLQKRAARGLDITPLMETFCWEGSERLSEDSRGRQCSFMCFAALSFNEPSQLLAVDRCGSRTQSMKCNNLFQSALENQLSRIVLVHYFF